ncbi:Arc family DNA-binding protein [Salmonella enterica subsp. enterica serovar Newport]|nr:Arc family DNA-binding protein [Salmonella enterica subsp. enterica serovar Newport]
MTKRDPQLNIRLPQELKDRLTVLAGNNKRSVNAEAVAAIEMAVILGEQSGLPNDYFVSGALKQMLLDGDVITKHNERIYLVNNEDNEKLVEIEQGKLKLAVGKNLIDIIQKTVEEVLNQQNERKSK